MTVETMSRALQDYVVPASRSLHATSLASIALCIGLWIRAKTVGEDERPNAERRALIVGLWPPMFWADRRHGAPGESAPHPVRASTPLTDDAPTLKQIW